MDWASLMGIAKPRPSASVSPDLAVTMPMTSPRLLYTGPPELPWFTAASIWNMLMPSGASSVAITRSRPLTVPVDME